ncbi:MAG TPA: RNA 2',3'-cyclic phosphodiesterase [Candidatus Limnocylindrales bacterium]|nr:RNA 2',3'-cyclic phosphodiesterase [Candidatus Limnocylindrales bacterium]
MPERAGDGHAEAPYRLFVAVPVPADVRDAVVALLEPFRTGPFAGSARWVHVETLHLTLRFLGDTDPALAARAGDAVHRALDGRPAFDVRLGGAGSFPPSGRKIRALWLGITQGADELGALARALDAPLGALGWPPDDRPYRPHLTIARTDATAVRESALVAQALEEAAASWETGFRARSAILYRSVLGGGPARHEPLAEVALRDPG